MKFHNHSWYSVWDMLRTKFKYENQQKAITQKLNKQELWFICTIHPQNFITLASIVLEIYSKQNLSMKLNKGQ